MGNSTRRLGPSWYLLAAVVLASGLFIAHRVILEQQEALQAQTAAQMEQKQAEAEIKKIGGHCTWDTTARPWQVTEVDLSLNDKCTDASLGHLTTFQNLREPNLCMNIGLTPAGFAHLEDLTSMQVLNLSATDVDDTGLAHLERLTNLRVLNLNLASVTDDGLVYLKGMAGLQDLDLSYNLFLTDAGLVHLRGLTNLRVLNLEGDQITDAGLVHLKGITTLQTLKVNRTSVTADGFDRLCKTLPGLTGTRPTGPPLRPPKTGQK